MRVVFHSLGFQASAELTLTSTLPLKKVQEGLVTVSLLGAAVYCLRVHIAFLKTGAPRLGKASHSCGSFLYTKLL
eukprot:IDg13873t1